MWTSLRSYLAWLHEPEHVARFQQYFGILPKSDRQSDVIPTFNDNIYNKNKNNNNNNNNIITNGNDDKSSLANGIYNRHVEDKLTYDSNVLDECFEEMKHNTDPEEAKELIPPGLDYRISSWFWYYFFQFGAALGNEIFYILFYPTW